MRLHRRLHKNQRQLSQLIALGLALALGVGLSATALHADERSDALDVFVPLAEALTNGDAAAFLKPVDPAMEGFTQLRDNVSTLLAGADVSCSIDLISFADGAVELDWSMQLKSKVSGGGSEQRRVTVKARIKGKKILSIGPVDFFRPLTP